MRYKYIVSMIGLFAVLSALVVVGCYHKTPEQRAEHMVRRLVSALNLDASQTAKVETMKEEFLAKRPEMVKTRKESMVGIKEMMLSPQIDKARLDARMEKIRANTSDTFDFVSARFIELHDMLTPEQRIRLVAELEKHAGRRHHW